MYKYSNAQNLEEKYLVESSEIASVVSQQPLQRTTISRTFFRWQSTFLIDYLLYNPLSPPTCDLREMLLLLPMLLQQRKAGVAVAADLIMIGAIALFRASPTLLSTNPMLLQHLPYLLWP
jgi:hypothetical protein